MSRFSSTARWYLLAVFVVAVDQLTKALVTASLTFAEPVVITGFFNLTLLHNTGAAFSILSDAGGWQRWFFAALAIVVSGVLTVWLWQLPRRAWWQGLALALVLGGALGNLWDRIVLGYVVDFIQVHYKHYYFPAFNVADSAITIGAILLIADAAFNKVAGRAGANE